MEKAKTNCSYLPNVFLLKPLGIWISPNQTKRSKPRGLVKIFLLKWGSYEELWSLYLSKQILIYVQLYWIVLSFLAILVLSFFYIGSLCLSQTYLLLVSFLQMIWQAELPLKSKQSHAPFSLSACFCYFFIPYLCDRLTFSSLLRIDLLLRLPKPESSPIRHECATWSSCFESYLEWCFPERNDSL